MKIVLFIVWCLFGFCLAMAGCRAAITAEKLEASVSIERPAITTVAVDEAEHD